MSRMFHFPFEGTDVVTVTWEDYEHLDPGQMLNDSIIRFYLRYLFFSVFLCSLRRLLGERTLADSVRPQSHFYSTFFYEKMTSKLKNTGDSPRKYVSTSTRGLTVVERRKARFSMISCGDGQRMWISFQRSMCLFLSAKSTVFPYFIVDLIE